MPPPPSLLPRHYFRYEEAGYKKLASSTDDFLVQTYLAMQESSHGGVAKGVVTLDTSIQEAAAYEMNKKSRAAMKHHETHGGLERELVNVNDHHLVYQIVYDFKIPGFEPREFVMSLIWKWTGPADDSHAQMTVVGKSVEHIRFPRRQSSKYVRGDSTALFIYDRRPEVAGFPQTQLTLVQSADVGGAVPKWIQVRRSERHSNPSPSSL